MTPRLFVPGCVLSVSYRTCWAAKIHNFLNSVIIIRARPLVERGEPQVQVKLSNFLDEYNLSEKKNKHLS